jgi:hypothetical protein
LGLADLADPKRAQDRAANRAFRDPLQDSRVVCKAEKEQAGKKRTAAERGLDIGDRPARVHVSTLLRSISAQATLPAAQTLDHDRRWEKGAGLTPRIMLAPTIKVVSTGNPSGQHKITKAGTGDRTGSTTAVAVAIALALARKSQKVRKVVHKSVRNSGGCGQGEDKCSCEKYLGFLKHERSP